MRYLTAGGEGNILSPRSRRDRDSRPSRSKALGIILLKTWPNRMALCGGRLAGLPARKQGPIVRPYVRRAAPEGLLQLVDDPVRELLRGGEHLEDVPAALDRHDLPLGLREARARCNVLDAPADGVLVRRGTTADEDPPEVLLAPPLLARGTHHPRGPRQQRMAHRVVAPPRPAREHRTAALANCALPRATCPCLDGTYLRASRAAAIETPGEALTLVHSTYPLMSRRPLLGARQRLDAAQ